MKFDFPGCPTAKADINNYWAEYRPSVAAVRYIRSNFAEAIRVGLQLERILMWGPGNQSCCKFNYRMQPKEYHFEFGLLSKGCFSFLVGGQSGSLPRTTKKITSPCNPDTWTLRSSCAAKREREPVFLNPSLVGQQLAVPG